MKKLFVLTSILTSTACGGGSSNPAPTSALSSGLKIFVTANGHVGDFANDPLLAGNNAIEKAD